MSHDLPLQKLLLLPLKNDLNESSVRPPHQDRLPGFESRLRHLDPHRDWRRQLFRRSDLSNELSLRQLLLQLSNLLNLRLLLRLSNLLNLRLLLLRLALEPDDDGCGESLGFFFGLAVDGENDAVVDVFLNANVES